MAGEKRGTNPNCWPIVSPETIQRFFTQVGKQVIYFAGYGELGYQDTDCVQRVVRQVLSPVPISSTLVLCGTLLRRDGHDGIAGVYPVAKDLGFETVGIHSSIAMQYGDTHRVSPYCDHVFFVYDSTWGGFIPGTQTPCQTLRVHLTVSDAMIIIGGGKYAADEMEAFSAAGKTIQYFPAEMDSFASYSWCSKVGIDLLDVRGAAQTAWNQLRR